MSLNEIIENNHYPIVFIGSGISKRYLKNSPTWTDLLEEYWQRIEKSQNFYSYLHDLNNKYKDLPAAQQAFSINTEVASVVEKGFNELFYSEKIEVPGLSLKHAQQNQISPFKFDIPNRFKSSELRDDINLEEFELFKKVLQKSRIIVTTNYDTLIEDTIIGSSTQKPKVFIGNTGFFDSTSDGWSEIYKIDGSSRDPKSIVINRADYDNYDQNSILISSKILSSMIDSPILFLGYSLTDRNIRKLLKDFSQQLPSEDARKSANRIFIVEYKPNTNILDEQIIKDDNLNFNYTLVQTDNYGQLYAEISKIDEGVTPFEVRRFQKVIKKIIVSSGQKNSLNSYLVSPLDLDKLEDKIDSGKPIVVALGDTKHIFVNPSPLSYLRDYLFDLDELAPEVALRFIASQNKSGRYPFIKYLNNVDLDKLNLEHFEIESIKCRINELHQTDLTYQKNKIVHSNQINANSLKEILAMYPQNKNKKLDIISWNASEENIVEITKYIKEDAFPLYEKLFKEHKVNERGLGTALKRLFLIWDLIVNQKK
ncbi:SIR2 family protein [Latilactobacillus sakei]|uniref:SIR2 family protein n=1 Tax=Latilactobacillus sakei TaxID=1599 RepID=UPI003F5319D6